MAEYFLDTSVLVAGIMREDEYSFKLLKDKNKKKITNDYAIKEMKRVLLSYGYSIEKVNKAEELIYENCEVKAIPPINRFKKLNIRDEGDKPIVQSAKDYNCILVLKNDLTKKDAKKYVKVIKPEEIY